MKSTVSKKISQKVALSKGCNNVFATLEMSKYRYFIAHFEKCWFCPYIIRYFYYVFLFLEDSGASATDEDRGQITIGYQPSLEQIALLTSEGHMTTDHVIKDVKTLAKNSSELVRQLQLCLVESVKEGLNNDVWSHIENVNNNFKNMYFSRKENLLGFSIFFWWKQYQV